MTLPKPKFALPITTAAIAFVTGAALLWPTHPASTQTVHLSAQTAPSTTTSSPTAPTATAPTLSTDATSPASPASGSSSPTTSPTSTSGTTTQTTTTTPAVTAVSAIPSGWQQDPNNQNVKNMYCTYDYSDGSSQSVLMQTDTHSNNGLSGDAVSRQAFCDLNDAPAAQ